MIRLVAGLVSILFVFNCFAQEQDIPLIRFRDHHYWIQTLNGRNKLPSEIEYILPFSNPTETFFIQNGKKGVVSRNGDILIPAIYKNIQTLNKGFYFFETDSLFIGNIHSGFSCKGKLIDKNDHWAVIMSEDSLYALNFDTYHLAPYQISPNYQLLNNYIFRFDNDTTGRKLYYIDSIGTERNIPIWQEFHNQLFIFKRNGKTVVINEDFHQEFEEPSVISSSQFNPWMISVAKNGRVKLMDTRSGKILIDLEGDEIQLGLNFNMFSDYFMLRKGKKWGLLDESGNWILNCAYDKVGSNNGFIYGTNKKGNGTIIRISDRKKFPFPYETIESSCRFYKVSVGGLFGVIDTAQMKEILPPLFANLKIEDTLIIGQNISFQRRLGLDSNLKVIYDLTVPKFRDYSKLKRADHDPRLETQGWFYEEKELLDKDGFLVGMKTLYGLQNDTGKVIRNPSISEPRFLFGRDFILCFGGPLKLTEAGQEKKAEYFNIAYSKDGRLNKSENILSIQTADVYSKSYIRYKSTVSQGIITEDGQFKHFDLIDPYAPVYPRVCVSHKGTKELLKPNKISFDYETKLSTFLPKVIDENTMPNFPNVYNYKRPLEYQEAKWNFLDNKGNLLFEESFDFVFPFEDARSIVQLKGRWGVISDTGFVLPPIFHDVTNFEGKMATVKKDDMPNSESGALFLVQVKDSKPILRDVNFRDLKVDFDRVVSVDEDLLLVEKNGQAFLVNEELTTLEEDANKTTFIGNGMYFRKEEDAYNVYDLNGSSVCSTGDYRPNKMIFDAFILCKKKGKYYVFSAQGDSVCQSKSKKFQITAETAFITDGNKFHILMKDGRIITSKKNLELLPDNEGKFYGTIEAGKVKIYNTEGQKIASLRVTETPYLVSGRLIFKDENWNVLNLETKVIEEIPNDVSKVEIFDQFYHLITLKDKKQLLYNNHWEEIPLKRRYRIQYWEEGVLLLTSQNSSYLYANEQMIELPENWKVIGKSHFGKIIVSLNDRQFYINQQGEMLFGKTFETCRQFNGEGAAVKSYSGWTLINEKGEYIHYPSFGEIINATENTFIEQGRTTYGLYDRNGNELLAPIYQSIQLVDADLISCLLDGHIVYFHLSDVIKNKKLTSIQF